MNYLKPLDLIGKTPLVKLPKLSHELKVNIYLKLESRNLTGSIKDRPALKMIEDAEKKGVLKKGMTIIESSSGNLGTSLACICKIRGYSFICVTDKKTSEAKENTIRAYGGKVIKVLEIGKNGSFLENRINTVKKLLESTPGSVNLDQYNNASNTKSHLETTGPEIFEDTSGKIDAIVGCLSTSGTMMGISKYFKSKRSKAIIVGVEPEGSILFGGSYKPYLQQGPGISFTPNLYSSKYIDIKVKVKDKDAFDTARLIARKEGLLVGGSSGAALYAAMNYAKTSKKKNIVVVSPDSGDKYLDTFFSDEWMKEKGMLD